MINWRRGLDTFLGLGFGLLIAGSLNDENRFWAASAAIAAAVVCMVLVRRAEPADTTA
jgi:hypothetical protein